MNIWFKILSALVLVVALFFGVNAYNGHQQQIGYDRAVAAVNADKIKKVAEANAVATEWKTKYQEAEDARAKLQIKFDELAATNARTVADVGKLRVQLATASAGRVSNLTAQTCPAAAATLGTIFDECTALLERGSDLYAALARDADGHAADAKALSDAWPVAR